MELRQTSVNRFDDNGYETSMVFPRTRSIEARRSVERMPRTAIAPAPEGSNAILDALSPAVQRLLAPSLKPVSLKKEQFIYQEGDSLDYIYFPITAVVSEYKMLEDGRMVEIAVTGKEGAVGLSSSFSGSNLVENCTQVSQAGTAQRLDIFTFNKLVRTDESMQRSRDKFLNKYLRQISQKAICNMYHSVSERLCTWLLMLDDRCGRRTFKLTHEQIARTLGVYRPSITVVAQSLREMNLIQYTRGGITLGDRHRIERAACSCYAELGSLAAS